MLDTIRRQAVVFVVAQIAVVLLVGVIFSLLGNQKEGREALFGGLCYGIPNVVIVSWLFRRLTRLSGQQFLVKLYIGETAKLLLGSIFLANQMHISTHPLSVMLGFIGAILGFWITAVIVLMKQSVIKP
jgi:F0F1-type ATP synthase assembly protein I